MANIFMAFFNGIQDEDNPGVVPIFYESFMNGLKNAGNELFAISCPFFNASFNTEMDAQLVEEIQKFNPDICIIFNNSFYDLSDILECPIVIFEVDSPMYFSNKEVLKKKTERFIYFVASTGSVDIIHDMYGVPEKNIFYVPFFTEVHADNTDVTTNIVFIGTKFQANPRALPNTFCSLNPSREEKALFVQCLEEIKKNPQVTIRDLIFKLQILSEKVALNLPIPEIAMYLSGERRIHVLSAIVDLGLELYGTESWARDYYYDYRLNLAYNNQKVYSLEHNQNIYNSSKIGISVSHVQATSGFPWRVMDIMASNACLVTDWHGDFKEVFPGIELPIYESEYEAREICKKLLQDEIRRKEIVWQCQEIIDKKYRFKHLLERMEEYSGIKLHTDN